MTDDDKYKAIQDLLAESAYVFALFHRDRYGLEGCEDPILIATEKLLEELKNERN